MSESFPSLARLVDARPYQMSPQECRAFLFELEVQGSYQILVQRGESDKAGQVKMFVTYERKT